MVVCVHLLYNFTFLELIYSLVRKKNLAPDQLAAQCFFISALRAREKGLDSSVFPSITLILDSQRMISSILQFSDSSTQNVVPPQKNKHHVIHVNTASYRPPRQYQRLNSLFFIFIFK